MRDDKSQYSKNKKKEYRIFYTLSFLRESLG